MKELYTDKQWVVAILDDSNYVIFDRTKPSVRIDKNTGKRTECYKYKYFNKIDSAILELSRLVANEEGLDLASWLESYSRHTHRASTAMCG
jgi:hypothetical protein